jgi:hypothetical protein
MTAHIISCGAAAAVTALVFVAPEKNFRIVRDLSEPAVSFPAKAIHGTTIF